MIRKRLHSPLLLATLLAGLACGAGPGLPAARAAGRPAAGGAVLYDGGLGGTPDSQGMLYQTFPFTAAATQSFANGLTTLDSTPQAGDHAGYFAKVALVPPLERFRGYALDFTVQVVSEAHAGSDYNGDGVEDRAGLSVIVLSRDVRGIELGFWPDEVWAQADGLSGSPAGPLFTHAEGSSLDTTNLASYHLAVFGDRYRLSANGSPVLSGPLRDYTAFEGPLDPYETPNLVFLGDDTTSAKACIRLGQVSVEISEAVYLPLLQR